MNAQVKLGRVWWGVGGGARQMIQRRSEARSCDAAFGERRH